MVQRFIRLLKRSLPRQKRALSRELWYEDLTVIASSDFFDRDFYLRQNPDVAASGMDPVEHFVRYGAAEWRQPSERFDTVFYLSRNPDVAKSGQNPLRHFIEVGRDEGRSPLSVAEGHAKDLPANGGSEKGGAVARSVESDPRESWAFRVISVSQAFDENYYLSLYPGVAESGMGAIEHFVRYGAREFRNPNQVFNTKYYLDRYQDVARQGINPLAHYLSYGWREFRDPGPKFSTVWYWLTNMGGALEAGSPLEHYLSLGGRSELKTYPESVSAAERRAVNASVDRVISTSLPIEFYERLAANMVRCKLWQGAERVYRHLVSVGWNVARNHDGLAQVLGAQGKRWQQIASIRDAIRVGGPSADRYRELGDAYEAMEHWSDAAESYKSTISAGTTNYALFYKLGYALEKSGSPDAAAAYACAIRLSPDKNVRRFGIGVLHQENRRWEEALRAYSLRLEGEPFDAHLHYRLGMAYDRIYSWGSAEEAYRLAISLEPGVAYWHYRLGFVRERMGSFLAAADAYQVAISVAEKDRPYWRYRRAYALMMAGLYEEACVAFLGPSEADERKGWGECTESAQLPPGEVVARIDSALGSDYSRADWHYARGVQLERGGDWQQAEISYRNAVDRCDARVASWYMRLGYVLYRQGKFLQACEALRETTVAWGAHGVDSSRYEKSESDLLLLSYNQYIEELPIRDRTILYESYAGVAIGCNPLAIFRRLISLPEYGRWTHVWVVASPDIVPAKYRRLRNVIFVKRNSDLYARYLATASHLVNNSTFPSWFIRRDGQSYLNTWHGTPMKTLGKDIKGNFMERKNTARNFLHATHLISPNRHTTNVLVDRYDVAGLISARVVESGYPRVDRLFSIGESERRALRERLGLTEGRPVVLYAPTWRGTLGNATVDMERLRDALVALSGLECQVLFRGHYFSEQKVREEDLPATIASYDIDTADLLSITDVLVTDYSSILFDFLPTRRPIIYFAYDREEYADKRGLYIQLDELSGEKCASVDELIDAVERAVQGNLVGDTLLEDNILKYCPHDDGQATDRVIDFFLGGALSEQTSEVGRDDRMPLLFYAGAFPPNGITTSFLNLLSALDFSRYRAVVVIDADAVEECPIRMSKFSSLPDGVQTLARVGRLLASPEERWVISYLRTQHYLPSDEMWSVYLRVHAREFRRLFGAARFHAVVQFDGYSPFWTSVVAGASEVAAKALYLHNDMLGEMNLKFPSLRAMFRLYREYDSLVSVSPGMCDANRRKLASRFSVDEGKFTYAENVINHERILEASCDELESDLSQWMSGHRVFLTMGRMSPEKDQAKLIRAFRVVRDKFPAARLLLFGDGPLREAIEQLVESLDLTGAVLLAGQRSNPFPALRASDCFVLSSNHEGQPMVLLEALTLGKPIIATDIDGNRGALAGRGGALVENSVEGLAEGMISFLEKGMGVPRFDPSLYRRSALNHFSQAVLDGHDASQAQAR